MASAVTPHIDLVLKSKGWRLRRFSIFLRNIPYACPWHQRPLEQLWTTLAGLELPYADMKQDSDVVPTLALTILQAAGSYNNPEFRSQTLPSTDLAGTQVAKAYNPPHW
jgi:hypothetical protein